MMAKTVQATRAQLKPKGIKMAIREKLSEEDKQLLESINSVVSVKDEVEDGQKGVQELLEDWKKEIYKERVTKAKENSTSGKRAATAEYLGSLIKKIKNEEENEEDERLAQDVERMVGAGGTTSNE